MSIYFYTVKTYYQRYLPLMENLKPALEKLFNTLGNQMTDDYYGKTFDFKVNEIKSFDDGYVQIYVSTTQDRDWET